MGASPLYVYMYVAMNNMPVLLYRLWEEKKKTTQIFLTSINPAVSAGATDIYTPLSLASRPMSNHVSLHQSIHSSIFTKH